MIRKTALLTGIAGLMLTAAPAFAQDAAPAPAQAAPAQTAPASQPGTLTLQPGSDVKGSDGAVLGKLEGVRSNAGTQELTVRGTDGQLRGVPLAGLKPEGTGVTVGWTLAEYTAAPAIASDAGSSSASASTMAPEQPAPDSASPEDTSTEAPAPAPEAAPAPAPVPEEPASPASQPQA